MDSDTPAQTHYDGGIIVVSYLVAVVGAMTTLELLQRRTHIRGRRNWFLLFAAAATMGGMGIWCMHFIGNNSLTITFDDGEQHRLSYSSGFTFASLVVSVLTMFLAFTFVGITEEAKVQRIIPSGIIAGFGIVSMHYLGQVAIDFFVMKNVISLVIAAVVIAVCAVTAALFIFFKLREQWANQWYKRLGCAMLMAIAVCGMHYTALIGTLYYPGKSTTGPPTPILGTPALIGIISAIVLVACIFLFFIGAKTQIENSTLLFAVKKVHKRRLILDTIFFDTNGKILVKVDGIVPMKEILNEIPEDEVHESFSTSHPLFTRLFETTIQWTKPRHLNEEESMSEPSADINHAFLQLYKVADEAFMTAVNELLQELRFSKLSDLGHLFDSVLTTSTISKRNIFSQESQDKKPSIRRKSSTASWLLSTGRFSMKESVVSTNTVDEFNSPQTQKKQSPRKASISLSRSTSLASAREDATVIDIFNNPTSFSSTGRNLAIRDSDAQDKHIFLVKKIDSNKDLVNLLSIGFRFAEPVFIAKTMGEKLKVPSEYLLNYFEDMLQMAKTATTMYNPIKSYNHSFYTSPAQQRQLRNDDVRGGVFVGLFTLIEDNDNGDMPYIVVQKQNRHAFPMVQLALEGDTDSERWPTELSRSQKDIILNLSGQSLNNVASIMSDDIDNIKHHKDSSDPSECLSPGKSDGSLKTLVDLRTSGSSTPNDEENLYHFQPSSDNTLGRQKDMQSKQFVKALETASRKLMDTSCYGKTLASSARLQGDIIDIPAFSLRSGPCQLILFRAHVITAGTRFAINQTLAESIKCVPFPVYRSYAYFVTDLAVQGYRNEQKKYQKPSSYLTQQRLYQSTAARNSHTYSTCDTSITNDEEQYINDLTLKEDGSTELSVYKVVPKGEDSSLDIVPIQQFSSLPPPPRVKRNKLTFPSGMASLEFLPNIMKGANSVPLRHKPSTSMETPVMLNLLPSAGRFWWLDGLYEETHNI